MGSTILRNTFLGNVDIVDVTLGSTATTTGAINLQDFQSFALHFGTNSSLLSTGGTFTVLASDSSTGTFENVFSSTGSELSVTVQPGGGWVGFGDEGTNGVAIEEAMRSLLWIKLESTASPGGDVSLKMVMK